MAPRYTSMPVFSDNFEQNAEMQMQYAFECRLMGVDPHYEGDTDDDYDPERAEYDYDYDDEDEED